MRLNQKLYDLFISKANEVKIEILSLGLGYTAVSLSDGGIGLAYTHFENKKSCMLLNRNIDFEGKFADQLLEKIKSENTVERSMALALINALNYEQALLLPEDPDNKIMFDTLKIGKESNVAMVGFFGPLVKNFKEQNITLEILDASRNLGIKKEFYNKLGNWADVLLLTSTSILNNTTEEILANVGQKVKSVMLGPSTPMVKEAFEHLPVNILAGTVPLDKAKNSKSRSTRHGNTGPS